ncbi:hypothetical protein NUH88_07330 [Nisaea acidiphila]|uniref:Uncharacterized protein n=1 Tax=Nisaea acidiphila TaxID=1862145 RepID=A0A9J7AZ07_9PROT|nr:hypothetical protein [Nisaea acidiphila]UUX51500.1 hypothetical protein NUH88_07330 [Nisaea acidiphila]
MMMALFRPRSRATPPANDLAAQPTIRPRGDSYVRIDGRDYPVRCWSPSGFTLAPYSGALIRRQKARVTLILSEFGDRSEPLEVSGEIFVDVAENGILSARWTGLPKYKVAALAEYFAGKLSA